MNNNKGSISVIFVIILSLLIGFVGLATDYGYSVIKDLELTNAIDAATLAAAQDLDDVDKARETANEYLVKNGVDPLDVVITFSDNNTSIKLVSVKDVENRFMTIFDIDTTEIKASAKVSIRPIYKVTGGIKPFGVEDRELIYGDEIVLKSGADGSLLTGNFGALAFGGHGACIFRYNAVYGYSGTLEVGDEILTEPGNMASVINPLRQSMSDDYSTFDNFSENSKRLWLVPIVNTMDLEGRGVVIIVGFAQFFVEDIANQAGQTNITGRFVKRVISGISGDTQVDYGAYSATLVE
jgi:hypothetical protein